MHGLLDGGRVNLLLEILAHELLNAREGLLQRGLSERAFTTELAVHGETAPLCHGRGLVLFAGLQELNSGLRGEHFIKVIVDLNHGGVDAGTEALHLKEGKLAVLGGLTVLDTKVIRDGLLDLTSTAGHARGGTAKLNEVLANGLTVEHSVESGNLVDAHGAAAEDLCYFVHGGDREKVVVLPLCKVEEGNACGLLVVARVLGENGGHTLVVLRGKVEESILLVDVSRAVLRASAGHAAHGHLGGRRLAHGAHAGCGRAHGLREHCLSVCVVYERLC
mmetsp:Transcript_4355/g.9406  ORF Transcript_4355/g.9406 Transcript_4355/m.9406 type:complete len:277 (-) Transcript_4355:95-925(-)